ncbi:MAG: alanine--glyoxylate aminotransferase family protein [Chloroflexota bacterium]|nr:alanine--glyoxylate aminotransferase family protein [Chloroflexota bacterium]
MTPATRRRFGDLNPPTRLLCGSGPSNPEPRVLRALATPLIGQFDPAFTAIMDDVMALERLVFQTENGRSFPVSGSSRAGLEAVVASLVEPGDRVVVGNYGRFGDLFCEIARRYGADVTSVDAEWGTIIEPDRIIRELRARRTKLVALVHADTSTGICQPIAEIGAACREHDALLVVDAVLSLGGCEVAVDDWRVDACVGGLQKCLGGPSGMAPLTYNDRVEAAMRARRGPPATNYLDLLQLQAYWSAERLNHHTAPTSMVYALREALRIVDEEGLEARWARHRAVNEALVAGLEAMGLELFGDRARKAPMITILRVPAGVDEAAVRRALLDDFGIEIMAAFGPLNGRVWRIGLMGYNARPECAMAVLGALEHVLASQGFRVPPGAGLRAAHAHLEGAAVPA